MHSFRRQVLTAPTACEALGLDHRHLLRVLQNCVLLPIVIMKFCLLRLFKSTPRVKLVVADHLLNPYGPRDPCFEIGAPIRERRKQKGWKKEERHQMKKSRGLKKGKELLRMAPQASNGSNSKTPSVPYQLPNTSAVDDNDVIVKVEVKNGEVVEMPMKHLLKFPTLLKRWNVEKCKRNQIDKFYVVFKCVDASTLVDIRTLLDHLHSSRLDGRRLEKVRVAKPKKINNGETDVTRHATAMKLLGCNFQQLLRDAGCKGRI
ncbi:hypothetical protein QR680_000504 [Steinernema hermaphroditum]|uniref:Uncharacterized protein n=1 Tax=Steinernema hermaphroditum TaxID=289476 RepID=A0AA39LEE2_9BILA|nr:hypothetical protein QR680_000504 [Steinernema hermaphroditum]